MIKERRGRIYRALCVCGTVARELIANSSRGFQQGFDVISAGSSVVTAITSPDTGELSAFFWTRLRMHSHALPSLFFLAVSYHIVLSPFHLINTCSCATAAYKMLPLALAFKLDRPHSKDLSI